ncbi:hypothetical protein HHI36_007195 [Cryptolaemus montrouzieri]|uniref:EB domain-containing protein n=1 Tax=Cryptolaemus montrouzieri TaxID=559131 RepID=A0ABD2MNT3_9CUCU
MPSHPHDASEWRQRELCEEPKRVNLNYQQAGSQVHIFEHGSAALELGDECNSDWECKESIAGSMCNRGRCSCMSFYARLNQTNCVQSTLLGYDCIVPEQCSMKVANSSCIEGSCRCVDGFLQFRKHTCLGRE